MLPLRAGDKLTVAHGIVLFKGLLKSCNTSRPATNTHNSSPPAKAMFSRPEKWNELRIAVVNLRATLKIMKAFSRFTGRFMVYLLLGGHCWAHLYPV